MTVIRRITSKISDCNSEYTSNLCVLLMKNILVIRAPDKEGNTLNFLRAPDKRNKTIKFDMQIHIHNI